MNKHIFESGYFINYSSAFEVGKSRCMAMRFDAWAVWGQREEGFQEGSHLLFFFFFSK